jgi:hypothetical protein
MTPFVKTGTTPVMFTPRDVQLGLGDRARGAMVVVSAASPQSESWFRFDDDVDFTTSMPPEQRPKIDKREGSGFRVQKAAVATVATHASAAP